MERSNDYVKAAFVLYIQTISLILESIPKRSNKELFDKLVELNDEHLIANLDKALVLFKDKE